MGGCHELNSAKLIDVPSVHSVRRRVKKPTHLIEKIIRKGTKYQERNISVLNYKEIVTDLIGLQKGVSKSLKGHLFEANWAPFILRLVSA